MDSINWHGRMPRSLKVKALDLTVQASELRLRDLFLLQAPLDDQWPDPYLESRDAIEAAEGDERRLILVDAYERAEQGPPAYGDPSGRAFYGTAEGVAVFVWVVLRRHQPDLTPEEAARIALAMDRDEYERLSRIAHGMKAVRTLERMLMVEVPNAHRPAVSWALAIEEVIEAHPGWTYETVYDLTVSEWRNARRLGKPEDSGVAIPPGADVAALIAAQRRMYYGEDGDG